jgi:hypothetical protein
MKFWSENLNEETTRKAWDNIKMDLKEIGYVISMQGTLRVGF